MSEIRLPDGLYFSPRQKWLAVNQSRRYARRLRQRYGDVVAMRGSVPAILALTPRAAKEIFTADPDDFKVYWKRGFSGLLGPNGMLALDGPRHRRERKLLAAPFQAHCFHDYGPIIQEHARRTTARWQPGQKLQALDAMLALSLEFILHLAFGAEEERLLDEGRRTMKSVIEKEKALFVFFPSLQAWWFPPWRRYARAYDEFRAFIATLLDKRRAQGEPQEDLLGRMMSARYEDGAAMNEAQIGDQLHTILGAGHESTATALAWALYELGRHPAILDRLRDEIDALGPAPDANAVVRLPYLSAVCDETLRRHVIFTEVGRVLDRPFDLLDYRIPAGWSLVVSMVSIHQDPAIYPEPDCFRPERFLERSFSPFEFLPFGGGHRRCLGAALSDYEMRLVLAHIVSEWEFELLGEESNGRRFIGTAPRHGTRLRLTRRRTVAQETASSPARAVGYASPQS